mmetsp:Transcript_26552/g.86829  ORF Transcript_26552/g.86829 Transcript_26552/m.86829 type:complete len:412 (-) Transcript_26552:1646-2881(-)
MARLEVDDEPCHARGADLLAAADERSQQQLALLAARDQRLMQLLEGRLALDAGRVERVAQRARNLPVDERQRIRVVALRPLQRLRRRQHRGVLGRSGRGRRLVGRPADQGRQPIGQLLCMRALRRGRLERLAAAPRVHRLKRLREQLLEPDQLAVVERGLALADGELDAPRAHGAALAEQVVQLVGQRAHVPRVKQREQIVERPPHAAPKLGEDGGALLRVGDRAPDALVFADQQARLLLRVGRELLRQRAARLDDQLHEPLPRLVLLHDGARARAEVLVDHLLRDVGRADDDRPLVAAGAQRGRNLGAGRGVLASHHLAAQVLVEHHAARPRPRREHVPREAAHRLVRLRRRQVRRREDLRVGVERRRRSHPAAVHHPHRRLVVDEVDEQRLGRRVGLDVDRPRRTHFEV